MKKIFKFMLLPALVLPLLFTSCDEDRDSNPSLDLSHLAEGFVLNIPALAENNTYDLNSAKNLVLTCSQPNYGGVPYPVKYYAQVSIDPAFVSDPTVTHKELATYAENPSSLDFNAYEANKAVVSLFRAANPEANIPEKMSVYIRLRAVIGGTLNQTLGETYSNVITLPSVKATIPDAKFTENLFLTGSSIQKPWESWKSIPQVEGLEGNYYGIIYVQLVANSIGVPRSMTNSASTKSRKSLMKLVQVSLQVTTKTSRLPTQVGTLSTSRVRFPKTRRTSTGH